jgi:hypothetical protein
VTHALALPCVAQIVTLGPGGKDLEWPELKFGNLEAVVAGRLEVFPWRRTRSRVVRRYGDTACWRQRGTMLEWVHLCERVWTEVAAEIAAAIPTDAVYLTIDKDAIEPAEAATNWDQGAMTVHQIEILVAALSREKRIVGADICGDYSVPRVEGLLRRAVSLTDRGKVAHNPEALSINSRTNARLVSALAALSPHV